MPDQIEAEAKLVCALGPGQVVAMRKGFIVTEQRHPVRNTESGVGANGDVRETTVPDVVAVEAGDSEDGAVVLSVVVRDDGLVQAV